MEHLSGSWKSEVEQAVELARMVSSQTDPQEMVQRYGTRIRDMNPADGFLSLSRRDLTSPKYRITRYSGWGEEVNPWKEKHKLPLMEGGLLAELIYGNEPRVLNDVSLAADEPAAAYLDGMTSLVAMPLYDGGESLNMVIRMFRDSVPDLEKFPDMIITANIFGLATKNLVMSEEVRVAYEALDREFQAIAAIQRSLLPTKLPDTPGLELATFYDTAHRAGGDYYDVFPVDEHRTGIMIADVSGHGAAAAVVMARMHASLHAYPGDLASPADVMEFANEHLQQHCTRQLTQVTFATAFYGVYDGDRNVLTYSSAGHNPPRLRTCDGALASLAGAVQLPLGIDCGLEFETADVPMTSRDEVLLYTDGIVEAFNPTHDQFGLERLDEVFIEPQPSTTAVVDRIVNALDDFADGTPFEDDRTLVAFRAK